MNHNNQGFFPKGGPKGGPKKQSNHNHHGHNNGNPKIPSHNNGNHIVQPTVQPPIQDGWQHFTVQTIQGGVLTHVIQLQPNLPQNPNAQPQNPDNGDPAYPVNGL